MKSAIFSIIPLVGFAVAQEGCTRRTVTKTETERFYVTVQPEPVPSDITITSTIDITTTSTIDTTTTITVHPSSSVQATVTGLHWGSYPNGTWGNFTGRPQPTHSTVSLDYSSSAVTKTPAPTVAGGEGDEEPCPTSEAAIPTSETPAVPTSKAPAVATSETPAAPTSKAPAAPTSETPAAAVSSSVAEAAVASSTPSPAEGVVSSAGSKSGEATFYGGNVSGGTCMFTGYTIPSGVFGTALSDSNWDSAGNCGACVSVTGPSGNKITAMVVDQCPGCGPNHLDLFPDGFAKLADPSKGVINVSWDIVPCGITTPIVLKNKEGTSPYWFSMQVENSNVPVASLEVSTDGGKTWQKTERKYYNFFENPSGFKTEKVDVKVTSTNGKTITVKDVSVAANSKTTAASNF